MGHGTGLEPVFTRVFTSSFQDNLVVSDGIEQLQTYSDNRGLTVLGGSVGHQGSVVS